MFIISFRSDAGDAGKRGFGRLGVDRFRCQLPEYVAPGLGISAWSAARPLRFSFRSSRPAARRPCATGRPTSVWFPAPRLDRLGLDFLPELGIACEGAGAQYSADLARAIRCYSHAGGGFRLAHFGGAGEDYSRRALRLPPAGDGACAACWRKCWRRTTRR